MSPPVVGYLTGRYPAVSHTFIRREVEALRRRGVRVETLTVGRTPATELLDPEDRRADATTWAIRPVAPRVLARDHLAGLRAGFGAWLATLGLALRLAPPGLRGRLWQVFYFAEAIRLWRFCRDAGIPHIHAQFANVATDVALLAAAFSRRTDHRMTWSMAVHGPVEFADVTLNRLAVKVRRATFTTCISDFARSQVMACVDEEEWARLEVVHCGVDLTEFSPGERNGDGAAGYDVLCVGRLVGQKGQATLLQAVATLRERSHDVRLTIVGDGPRRAALERIARELRLDGAVTFTGALGQDAVRALYARASVYCSASFAEGLPVVLMEAMAMEVPVVATRIAGVPELVRDGRTGRTVAPGRADELADALESLLTDPEEAARLARAGRAEVEARFDVHRSAARLEEILRARLRHG